MRQPLRQPHPIRTSEIENYEIPPSYLIYKDGAYTIAVNGNTGKEDSSSTESATVIQYALDQLATAKGTVYIRKAATDYEINTKITPKDRVNIIGEKDACLKAGCNLVPAMFDLEEGANTVMRMTMSGFRLEGNNVCNFAIGFDNVYSNMIFEDMEILGFVSVPVNFKGNVWGVTMRNILITAPNGGYGIRINRTSGAGQIGLNNFYYVHISGAGTAIRIIGDAYKNTFYNCHITTTGTYGVYIAGDGTYTPYLSIFRDCWFERGAQGNRAIQITDVGAFTTRPELTLIENCHIGNYDIAIYLPYASKTTIRNNYFSTNATDDINMTATALDTLIEGGVYSAGGIGGSGTRTLYEGQGFKNTGVAAMLNTNATVTVAHGLALTPTIVLATGTHAEVNDLYVTAVGAANFTINSAAVTTADRDIYWEARVR